jgi:hypothetical protein
MSIIRADCAASASRRGSHLKHLMLRCRLVGALASLAGVGLYNYRLKHTPLRWVTLPCLPGLPACLPCLPCLSAPPCARNLLLRAS